MDRLNQAILVLDGQYGVLQVNAAGQSLLEQGDALIKLRGGCIDGLGDRVVPPLAEGFARADGGMTTCLAYRLDQPTGTTATGIARLTPLTEQPLLGLPAMRARYLLVIEPPGHINPAALDAFGQLFGLTRAEQSVLTHLTEDATPQEIATALGVGLPTVRTHLRNLHQKTGVRRHAELIRLALAGMRAA